MEEQYLFAPFLKHIFYSFNPITQVKRKCLQNDTENQTNQRLIFRTSATNICSKIG